MSHGAWRRLGFAGVGDDEEEKRLAAEMAAELVEDGMVVGLGTGSTVAYLLPALARRAGHVVCVATSAATEEQGRRLGLDIRPFEDLSRLDIAIDGADQVSPEMWLVKGGGGAHTREKIVAAAADRFVVIVSSNKLVGEIHQPVPLELMGFGLAATLRNIGQCRLRPLPPTPDGGVLAEYVGEVGEPGGLASRLAAQAGVVDHGLFPPELVTEVLVGNGGRVDRLSRR
jgi:ribose 5-phosphate isomerase A